MDEESCKVCGGAHATGACVRVERGARAAEQGGLRTEVPVVTADAEGRAMQREERLRQNDNEKAMILAEALRSGDYLKVRNKEGELVDSNLSPEQWVTVRTAAFKNWFGDWQNDPENASQIVDANGEPLVVFHGTKRLFTSFDTNNTSSFKKSGRYKNVGGFFTRDYQQALDYTYTSANDPRYSGEILPTTPSDERVIRAFLNVRNLKDYRQGGKISIGMRALTPELRDELRRVGGYDAVRFRYDTEIVVFDANQIKSADKNEGLFDATSNDMLE